MRDTSADHDVFISYAHIDNQPLIEGQAGWIATLHHALERRLEQLLGETIKIWRDPKLRGNDYFDGEIVSNVIKASVLVAVLSPRYVRSEWCSKELKKFVEEAARRGGMHIEKKSHIFKVIKTPIPLEEHPTEVQGLLGYEFFQRDPETQRLIEFNQVLGQDAPHKFLAKLEDLAFDI
jgi:hypothetical protein